MNIEHLIQALPLRLDLTDDKQAALLIDTAEKLIESYDLETLNRLEDKLMADAVDTQVFILSAIKLAQSKHILKNTRDVCHFTIVFAMYKEHNRIKKHSEHPHGENFLIKKVEQLQWLFAEAPHISWQLMAVDDGCPENSGGIAQQIIDDNNLQKQVKVLYLADAIAQKKAIAQTLSTTNDSQKGGAMLYGMSEAAVQRPTLGQHIICFTDADLSTHLGQLMLLAQPILEHNKLAAIASRREKKSVVIKTGSRNHRGKLFIYLWKRMIPNLGNIVDTQCGFKAFRADVVPTIVANNLEMKFAFDIELLLKTANIDAHGIAKVPIAWIDSEAASTTTDLQPYLPMLKSIAAMQQKYFSKAADNAFAPFVSQLSEADFQKLLEAIPTSITDKDPSCFSEYDEVSVADLQQIVG